MRIGLIVQAVAMTVAVLGAYYWALHLFAGHLQTARTIAFATLVLSELWRAFTARSDRHSIFRIGIASNKWMLLAVASSLMFLLLIIYVPFLRPVFDTVALTGVQWLRLLPFTLVAAIAAEITKTFLRNRERSRFTTEA
jgi:Ca2+-transporting ATPase